MRIDIRPQSSLQITGLSAIAGIKSVSLTWDAPSDPLHKSTEVWSASVDNVAQAVKLVTVNDLAYVVLNVPSDAPKFYWVRSVNIYGRADGPWSASVSKAGLPESSASPKMLSLDASSQVFGVSKLGVGSPALITLFGSVGNLIGAPTWTIVSGTGVLADTANPYQKTLTFSDMSTELITVELSQDGLKDQLTIIKVKDGSDTVTGMLTNESANVSANSSGTVSSYSNTGGTFRVFEGTLDKTTSATFSVVSTSNLTISISAIGVYTISSMSADTGTATLRAVYKNVTIDKVYTLSKAKQGVQGPTGTGTPGSPGEPGMRGTVDLAKSGYSSWNSAAATAEINIAGYGVPQQRDRVTLYSSTFSETRYYDGLNWVVMAAYINGNLLVSGTVSAASVATGSGNVGVYLTGAKTVTDNAGNAITNGAYFYQNSGTLYAMYGKNSFTGTGGGVVRLESFGTGYTLQAIANNTGTASRAVVGQASGGWGGWFSSSGINPAIYGENYYGGHGARIRGGQSGNVACSGLVGTSGGQCFYAEIGSFGPFTGSHDAMVSKQAEVETGDIMVDTECLAKNGVNDSIFLVERSTKPYQRAVIGIAVDVSLGTDAGTPAAFIDKEATALMIRADMGDRPPVATPAWAQLREELNYVGVNSIGEGQINVCGEGGDIESGDFIVSSSIPGKGMRMDMDLPMTGSLMTTVVARAREAVKFSSPTEVIMTPCIYMCG